MQDRIRISCSRQNLQRVRDFVRGFLLDAQRSDLVVNQVVLAVDEVVANFIIHANGEDTSQFLDLLLVLADHHLDIEIEDHGSNLYLPAGKVANPDMRAYIQQGPRVAHHGPGRIL
jgi:serine/threonine-protein kinase RsbW